MTEETKVGHPVLIPALLVAMVLALAVSLAPATAQGPPPACDGQRCVEHQCADGCICNLHHDICLDNT